METKQLNRFFHSFYQQYTEQMQLSQTSDGIQDWIYVPESKGGGSIQIIPLRKGLELVIADYHIHEQQMLDFQCDVPMIELSFCLKGASVYTLNGKEAQMRADISQLFFFKDVQIRRRNKAEEHMIVLEIKLSLQALEELMADVPDHIRVDFFKIIGSESVRSFLGEISPAVQLILHQILTCPYQHPLKRLFLESKVLELITIYFQQYFYEWTQCKSASSLKASDVKKLYQARELLVEQIDQSLTLVEIARKVGLNDFKLKKGFKEVFGHTVFGYLREQRMKQAIVLLQKRELNIGQIALTVGYTNPSHFAAAFRKQFGVNPSEFTRGQ
ncbi:helix-turn-helix transcriptional regulator [Bacillus sp. FJAT-42315]|uniref:helix-turn-helix transcriptional regulator n=1 Tax=Bacillus sp. FJAT-42315 TaxID=2014077 RepID=UPI0012FEE479|nr:AraC family transcriptional regulator [Bacillus sp. FJAT-42315]